MDQAKQVHRPSTHTAAIIQRISMNYKNKQEPLVSVAMCTFNGENFIREQLDSLVAQDYQNLEIIIVDDQSTDQTHTIEQQYAVRHPHIRLFRNDKNLGYVKNFEKALSLCNGDYIALCDQDDIWLPNKISTQLREIGDASLTYSEISHIDQEGKAITMPPRKTHRLSGRCPLALLFGTCVTGHLALFKRDVLNFALPFPEGTKAHDHWIPFVAAGLEGLKATDHILSYYRMHDQNVSRKRKRLKAKKFLTRFQGRERLFARKLEARIQFLNNASACAFMTDQERALLSSLKTEMDSLKNQFYNKRLQKFFEENESTFLSMYKSPKKLLRRLSKGIWFYRIRFFSSKP